MLIRMKCIHLFAVKQLSRSLPELCQLCFEQVPAMEQEKHLLEYHKIVVEAIDNKKPLRNWFNHPQQ
jgi:hypothetical protein